MTRHPFLATALALALALAGATASAQSTWLVDLGGGGDFTQIAEAVASPLVADGDTLLVEPGSYASFTLDKALAVVGPGAGPAWRAVDVVVPGVASFTLTGFELRSLIVRDVPGRARLEDGEVGWLTALYDGSDYQAVHLGYSRFRDCGQVVASHVRFFGSDACYLTSNPDDAYPAVHVTRSSITLVECELDGGNATGAEGTCNVHYPFAGDALAAVDSQVLLAGCRLDGGYGDWTDLDTAALRLRGSSAWIVGLPGSDAIVSHEGLAIDGQDSVAVLASRFEPAGLPAWVTVPAQPPAWLRTSADYTPGGVRSVDLFGPVGTTALPWVSFVPALVDLGAPFTLPLWSAPASLLTFAPLPLQGPSTPASLLLPLPADPAFAGIGATFQALVVPGTTGAADLTNPGDVVLRW